MSEENVEIVQRVVNHFVSTLEFDAVQDAFAANWVLDPTHATRVTDHLPRYVRGIARSASLSLRGALDRC